MVDVTSINTNGLGAKVSAGFSTSMVYLTVALIVVAILALVWWQRYLKSFNHLVVIKRPVAGGGFELDWGYKGRFVFKKNKDNTSKRIVFQIYQARKKKLNYAEESDAYDKRIPITIKGMRRYLIIMEPDSENFLNAVSLNDNTPGTLEAVLSQPDLAFYEAELQNIASKYDQEDFMGKYGLLIFIILILIIAALYWWGATKNAEAVKSIADAVGAQAQTQADLTKLITGLINGTVKMSPPQTVTVIS